MGFLDDKPTPEQEFAEEIAAAEKELNAPDSKPEKEQDDALQGQDEEVQHADSDEGDHEQADEQGQEEVTEPREQHKVPVEALKEEREKRQQYERELGKLQGQMETLLNALGNQEQQEENSVPNPEEDPIGALKHIQEQLQGLAQQQQNTSQEQQLRSAYWAAAHEFKNTNPEFEGAYKFLINSRANELRSFGLSEAEVSASLAQEELGIAQRAFSQQQNPGAILFEIAKARGFQPGQAQKAQGQPAPAPQTIEQQQVKQQAATSISSGGKPPRSTITDKDLANLSGDEFDKAWNKIFGDSDKTGLNFAR